METPMDRKRIWEVDCASLDAALAASFDWRELANLLRACGIELDAGQPEDVLEMQAQNAVHRRCHDANEISLKIEQLLNLWHAQTIREIDALEARSILFDLPPRMGSCEVSPGGVFWALGTDNREGFDCLRRHFYQRIMMRMARGQKMSA